LHISNTVKKQHSETVTLVSCLIYVSFVVVLSFAESCDVRLPSNGYKYPYMHLTPPRHGTIVCMHVLCIYAFNG